MSLSEKKKIPKHWPTSSPFNTLCIDVSSLTEPRFGYIYKASIVRFTTVVGYY